MSVLFTNEIYWRKMLFVFIKEYSDYLQRAPHICSD